MGENAGKDDNLQKDFYTGSRTGRREKVINSCARNSAPEQVLVGRAAGFPGATLADLYDPLAMPPALAADHPAARSGLPGLGQQTSRCQQQTTPLKVTNLPLPATNRLAAGSKPCRCPQWTTLLLAAEQSVASNRSLR